MLITRDKAKLRNVPFVRLTVDRSKTGASFDEVKATFWFDYQEAGRDVSLGRTPLCLRVVQAFDKARRFAKEKNISAIWIDDPDGRFPDELFEMALSE